MRYPHAERLDLVETLHGRSVADPYRWLEDVDDPRTIEWSKAQDELARAHLDSLAGRDYLARRLRELVVGFEGPPAWRGDRAFFSRRLPEQEHAQYLVREPDGEVRVLVDPSALSDDDTVTLDGVFPSKEGDLLAYMLSEGGTEDPALWVMDVTTREVVDGPLDMGRGGAAAWVAGGKELIAVRRLPGLAPDESQFHRRVWRHRLGSDATDDEVIFGDGRDKTTYYGVGTSLDGRWLHVSCSLGTAPRNDLYLMDLETRTWATVQEGVDAETYGGVAHDGRLYLHTNVDAPRNRLVVADPVKPRDWSDLLPEVPDAVLASYAITDDALVACRQRHAITEVAVHDLATGEAIYDLPLPGLGVAGVNARQDGGDEVWLTYTDHVTPTTVFRHRISTRTTDTWATAPGAVEIKGISVKQLFVSSKDGTKVPMFVISRDDRDGPAPAAITGYGGFTAATSPAYAGTILAWVEAGGVFADTCLRGGSEYGEAWHRAGMRANKQNVFDDYIACGDALVSGGYTTPDQLAITGGSNGGLLVGAALTQRPDLCRAVVCSAPLLDMIRYEKFGLGVTWNDEYGTAEDAEELGWLIGYSPYHRVEKDTAYPAVLFTVFESDTRVDPLHARKMCAALQWATTSDPNDRPVLIRRETKVGHGARSISRSIELAVDTLTFRAHQVGLELREPR